MLVFDVSDYSFGTVKKITAHELSAMGVLDKSRHINGEKITILKVYRMGEDVTDVMSASYDSLNFD